MQLFALTKFHQLVAARHASKKIDYFCLECGGIVRQRGGHHRQDHFYHLSPEPSCRQSQKSLVHLQIQHYLHTLLPDNEVFIENRFPEINRIADVCWESKKIIFEVQYSPISKEEVENRNRDYAKLGYQVVWILHDHRFNKWKITSAEHFLQTSPHYYTNMDSMGRGIIYDQVLLIDQGRRKLQKMTGEVFLSEPRPIPKDLPAILHYRANHWPFHFANDLIDTWHHHQEALKQLEPIAPSKTPWLIYILQGIKKTYRLFFDILLESCCK